MYMYSLLWLMMLIMLMSTICAMIYNIYIYVHTQWLYTVVYVLSGKTATPLCQLCSRTARAVAKGMVAAHSQTSRLWLSTVFFLCESIDGFSSSHAKTMKKLEGHSHFQG